MARLFQKARPSGHKILIVDDTGEVVDSTRLLLQKDGHEIETAFNGPDGIEKMRHWQPHLVILDYFMPGMTGEEVVQAIRPTNKDVQILLQTGYASEKPPRQMLHKLDIQGYHDKSEGPEKLLIWVDASLKAYRQLATINKSRQGLRHILDAVPEMYNLQTLEELLKGILEQMEGLLGGQHSFVAALPQTLNRVGAEGRFHDGLSSGGGEDEELEIVAGTGRFAEVQAMESVDREQLGDLRSFLASDDIREVGSKTYIPLRVGTKPLGIVYFERNTEAEYDSELLRIFAMQASQALENRRLFGLATEDDLTRVYLKAFFFKRMEQEVQEALRYEYPISLAIIDVDHFKTVNDTRGHIAGDQVLREISSIIRMHVRGHDFVGRFGGDEFVIALPHTDAVTAAEVLEDLRREVEAHRTLQVDEAIKVTMSCGVATLQGGSAEVRRLAGRRAFIGRVVEKLLESADRALYVSKQKGRNAVSSTAPLALDALMDDLAEVARGGS